MDSSILTALITGGLSLAGVIISNLFTSKRTDQKMETALAVMDTKLAELTREVREHNGFAHKIPVIEEQIKVINHRIDDLERKVET